MEEKKIYLTHEGLEALKKELKELNEVKRPELLESLEQARNQGDLSENAEYQAAKEDLAFVDGRIDELDELLKQVVIIEEKVGTAGGKKIVALGTTVTLDIKGKKQTYIVVGEWEANPQESKISHESPLGKALIGKGIGDTVEVEAPVGKIVYTITNLE